MLRLVELKLPRRVAKALRATGSGWQARADEALRAWIAADTASRV